MYTLSFTAFVPIRHVRACFNAIVNSPLTGQAAAAHPELGELLNYFDDFYINGRFQIALWNVFHRTMDTRSNNRLECKYTLCL